MKKKKKYLHKLAIMTLATSLVAFLGISTTTYKKTEATTQSYSSTLTLQTSEEESQDEKIYVYKSQGETQNNAIQIKYFKVDVNYNETASERTIIQNYNQNNLEDVQAMTYKTISVEIIQVYGKANTNNNVFQCPTTNYLYEDFGADISGTSGSATSLKWITKSYMKNSMLDWYKDLDYTDSNRNMFEQLFFYEQDLFATEIENTQTNFTETNNGDWQGSKDTNLNVYATYQQWTNIIRFNYLEYTAPQSYTEDYNYYTLVNTNDWDLFHTSNVRYINGFYIPATEGNTQDVINIPGLMFEILTMPFTFISMAFNLTLFPGTQYQLNISTLFLGILAVIIFVFIIKMLIKMGK